MSPTQAESEEVVQARCAAWLAEAIEQRRAAAVAMPKTSDPPEVVSDALITVRAHLDRVEAIYLATLIFRGVARAQSRFAADTASGAWDTKSAELRRIAVGDRFQSGRQHEADVNLEILPVLAVARSAARVAELADATSRQVEVIYRGMDGARQDIGRRLGYLQWERHLER